MPDDLKRDRKHDPNPETAPGDAQPASLNKEANEDRAPDRSARDALDEANHDERRRTEPAAANKETDGEAGAQLSGTERPADVGVGVPPQPDAHTEAARHEVRAGPGDAGASGKPQILERGPGYERRAASATRLNGVLIAVALLLLFIVLFTIF